MVINAHLLDSHQHFKVSHAQIKVKASSRCLLRAYTEEENLNKKLLWEKDERTGEINCRLECCIINRVIVEHSH